MRADRDEIISSLSSRITDYSVIPFVGAGCSAAMLRGNDWDNITNAMVADLGAGLWADPTVVAQEYEDRFGRERLCEFLRSRLLIDEFADHLGTSCLALMAMQFPFIYTTNVDNVIESCYAKYRRALTTVARLQDLGAVRPGTTVLYKYHGSLDRPHSLVWTGSDYARRDADSDFFLNVRLRSDLLTKTLLFIGYSLRDPHVVNLIARMQSLYSGGVRQSIVIAMDNAEAFRERLAGLDVRIISPMEFDVRGGSAADALDRFLNDVATRAGRGRAQTELTSLLSSPAPTPMAILSRYELKVLERVIPEVRLEHAIRAFREACDRRVIPEDFQSAVADAACLLIRRAYQEGLPEHLEGLLLNLTLPFSHMFRIWYHAYTLYAVGWDRSVPIRSVEDTPELQMALIAGATGVLLDWGQPLNTRFANWVAARTFDINDFRRLPEARQAMIGPTFEEIFEVREARIRLHASIRAAVCR